MSSFRYIDERFADLQMLRYRLEGFERLSLQQKKLIFFLSKAALFGRDITFDQYGRYNLLIRRTLEAVYTDLRVDHDTDQFRALEVYLKRVWFSNGMYHHYGCEKFEPQFTEDYFREAVCQVDARRLPLANGQTASELCDVLCPVIFDPTVLSKRVNKADGEDLLLTSACNFYDGVTQAEAEAYYNARKDADDPMPPSYGLNSTLTKRDGQLCEDVWSTNGRYANALRHIVYWLRKAAEVAENDCQREVIVLSGHVVQGAVRFYVLNLHARGFRESEECAQLIGDVRRCLFRRYVQVSAAESHEIRKARMGADANAGFFCERDGFLHHFRI